MPTTDEHRSRTETRRGSADVCLSVAATSENVEIARQVAAGAAEAVGLELEPAARFDTIAAEASQNVVEHAYAGASPGPMELRIELSAGSQEAGGELSVAVSDRGTGFQLGPSRGSPEGLGLSLISGLSDGFALRSTRRQGSEVQAGLLLDGEGPSADQPSAPDPDVSVIEFAGTQFLASVLPRALAGHVWRLRTTIERVAQAMQLGEAISRGLLRREAILLPLWVTTRTGDDDLEVEIGPLDDEQAGLVAAELDRLAAESPELAIDRTVERDDPGSRLSLSIPLR